MPDELCANGKRIDYPNRLVGHDPTAIAVHPAIRASAIAFWNSEFIAGDGSEQWGGRRIQARSDRCDGWVLLHESNVE
jgi:hypothetical protein